MGKIWPNDYLFSACNYDAATVSGSGMSEAIAADNAATGDVITGPVVDLGSGNQLAKVLATFNAAQTGTDSVIKIRTGDTAPVTDENGAAWTSGAFPNSSDFYPINTSTIDSFGATLDTGVWTVTEVSGGTVSNVSGQLKFNYGATTGYQIVQSVGTYGAAGDFVVTIDRPHWTGTVGTAEQAFVVADQSGATPTNRAVIYLTPAQIVAVRKANGSEANVATASVTPANVSKYRISRTGTVFKYEYYNSATSAWVTIGTYDFTTNFTGAFYIRMYVNKTGSSNCAFYFDNLTLGLGQTYQTVANGATSGLPTGRYAQWQITLKRTSGTPASMSNVLLATDLTPPDTASMAAAAAAVSGGNYLIAGSWGASASSDYAYTQFSIDGSTVATDSATSGNVETLGLPTTKNTLAFQYGSRPTYLYARFVDSSGNAGSWSAAKAIAGVGGGGSAFNGGFN